MIKKIAQAKKISQRQLFFKSAVYLKTIQRIFKDPHTNITIETLDLLAVVLEVDISDLVEYVRDINISN